MFLHQIWVGAPLPEREKEWVEPVQRACTAAGWQHKLWGWEELEAEFAADPTTAWFRLAFATHPAGSLLAVIASDYYRLAVLARFGGLYLDTDWQLAEDAEWPEWPTAADVYGQTEFFGSPAHPLLCNGIFWAPPEGRGQEAFGAAAAAAGRRLRELCPLSADDPGANAAKFAEFLHDFCHLPQLIGPAWVRQRLLPIWERLDICQAFLPPTLAGHKQWRGASTLTHQGAASWWHQPQANSASGSEAALPSITHSASGSEPQVRPPDVGARIVLPPASPGEPKSQIPNRKSYIVHRQSEVDPPVPFLSLPAVARRILIFSNVTQNFPTPQIRPGDILVHINRARHAEQLMREFPTHCHVLFVRASGKGRWLWFWPENVQGFSAVVPVKSAIYRHNPWSQAWKQEGGGNPTTGFIAAQILRESHPDLPITLVGFAPARDCGTYRSPVHDWQREADWYAAHPEAFTILPPAGEQHTLHLIVTTCRFNADLRAACRSTWLRFLPPGATYEFIAGAIVEDNSELLEEEGREPGDLAILPVRDSYTHLPEKVISAFRRALQNPSWQWLGKCDDDTFLYLPRLVETLKKAPAEVNFIGSFIGARALTPEGRGSEQIPTVPPDAPWAYGGAGYFLRRAIVEQIVANHESGAYPIPAKGAEDFILSHAAIAAGARPTHSPYLHQCCGFPPSPSPDNQTISCHGCTPEFMQRNYELFL